jgi:hypothetical protein
LDGVINLQANKSNPVGDFPALSQTLFEFMRYICIQSWNVVQKKKELPNRNSPQKNLVATAVPGPSGRQQPEEPEKPEEPRPAEPAEPRPAEPRNPKRKGKRAVVKEAPEHRPPSAGKTRMRETNEKVCGSTRVDFSQDTIRRGLASYEYRCAMSGQRIYNRNKPSNSLSLRFQIDHRNGDSSDASLENFLPICAEIHDEKTYHIDVFKRYEQEVKRFGEQFFFV